MNVLHDHHVYIWRRHKHQVLISAEMFQNIRRYPGDPMCQCYQIGGPFIAEDPDCPVHGREAQQQQVERQSVIDQLEMAVEYQGSPDLVWEAAQAALQYLRSL